MTTAGDSSKLERLASSAGIGEGDLENIRTASRRYLEIAGPVKQFPNDGTAAAAGR